MEVITLDILQHREKEIVLLKFPYNKLLIEKVKKLTNISWSKTHRSWYTTYTPTIVKEVEKLFTPDIRIDYSPLREKLQTKKKKAILQHDTIDKIERFRNWLLSSRYSENTIGTYIDALKTFFRFYSTKLITEINNDDIINFNTNYILANDYSASFQNQVVNAIKLFYRVSENKHINLELIQRPKRPKLLPNVLSKEEIKKILDSPSNLKHKAMLSLIYSCGLRRSELLNLCLTDVDSKRRLLIIRQSKGRKDRIVPLSDKIIDLLRAYYKSNKPKQFLFEGQSGGRYSEKSLESVLKQALERAKIRKPVSLHWLRHSYATHLLENGTDLRFIQEILGHNSSKTTEIYTHVSTKSIQNIKSPFDDL